MCRPFNDDEFVFNEGPRYTREDHRRSQFDPKYREQLLREAQERQNKNVLEGAENSADRVEASVKVVEEILSSNATIIEVYERQYLTEALKGLKEARWRLKWVRDRINVKKAE